MHHYCLYIMGKTGNNDSFASPKATPRRRSGKSSKVGQSSPARKKSPSPQSSMTSAASTAKKKKARKATSPGTPVRRKAKQSSRPTSSSTSSSKRNLSRMNEPALVSPEDKKSSKKHRPKKSVAVASGKGKGDASIRSKSLPKFTSIDWESQDGILQALSKYNKKDQYQDLSLREQIILLASNFTPTDLRPLLMRLLASAGEDFRNIDWDNYRSTKRIARKCAQLIITIVNAKTNLSGSKKVVVK